MDNAHKNCGRDIWTVIDLYTSDAFIEHSLTSYFRNSRYLQENRIMPKGLSNDFCKEGECGYIRLIDTASYATSQEKFSGVFETEIPTLALVNEPTVEDQLQLLKTGVKGIWSFSEPLPSLARAMVCIARGESIIPPRVATQILDKEKAKNVSSGEVTLDVPSYHLSEKETQVGRLMCLGLTNRQIGTKLGLSDRTIKFHVQSILRKTKTQSRTEAAVLLALTHLVDLGDILGKRA